MLYVIIHVIMSYIETYYKSKSHTVPGAVKELLVNLSFVADKQWHMVSMKYYMLGHMKNCDYDILYCIRVVVEALGCEYNKNDTDLQFVGRLLTKETNNIMSTVGTATKEVLC